MRKYVSTIVNALALFDYMITDLKFRSMSKKIIDSVLDINRIICSIGHI